MRHRVELVLEVAGLASIVVGAFLLAAWVGCVALGAALLLLGNLPKPRPTPKPEST